MKKYNVIYADPPWSFKTYSAKGKEKSPEQHYSCMTLEDIKKLPVGNICADDCALFLWATSPMLPQALAVMEEWGFEFKTVAFTWVKTNKKSDSYFFGLGYWTRQNAEFCLLGVRGKPARVSKGVSQIIDEGDTIVHKIAEHSKKPDVVRDRIVELCGDVPRVEFFARQQTAGWDCIGNEINGLDIRDVLEGKSCRKVTEKLKEDTKTLKKTLRKVQSM